MFTKSEMQVELREFMVGFTKSLSRMYGSHTEGALLGMPGVSKIDTELAAAAIEKTPLWYAVCDMYDYGVCGRWTHLHDEFKHDIAHPEYLDAEMFLRGLSSLALYLDEDAVNIPKLAVQTVQTAIARHILDGGQRWTDYEDTAWDHLTFAELALLADMDERSVRNAANPKIPGALVTTAVGKRSVIAVEEARRWLSGRKGFVPSSTSEVDAARSSEEVAMTLPAQVVEQLTARASASKLTPSEYLEKILREISTDSPAS